MGLNLGLAALDSYYKEGDARKEREYVQAKRDADMATLGDVTAERRTGAQLRSKQNTANLGLVDSQADLAKNKLSLDQANTKAAIERQPTEQATAANNAEVAKTLSEFNVDDLPRVIAEKRRAGVFSEADAATTGIAKLADLIQIGDTNQVINFMNGLNAAGGNKKPPVAAVGVTQDPKTGEQVFVAQDAQGNHVMQISQSQMKRVRDSVGKTDLKVLNAGDSLVGVKNGQASVLATAPEKASTLKQHTPAEVQTMEWLISKGVAKDANGAWDMVRSAREKTRNSFIMDYVGKNALPGSDTNKMSDEAGKIYDSLKSGSGASHAPSNNGSAGTVDPRINSLIGVPSQ
ncbi:hypothetical protein UFOVP33_9 [uncultured Caudovirales phage]|uniref:Uncharacterized protein n=1 Tax=uncultured Caudovirales phage TaxID=2100421 RepID=A0A6J5KMM7_9CAUD|nr:hypothetical protein UFOVP33_9 [uncultured Caudovirales phage]